MYVIVVINIEAVYIRQDNIRRSRKRVNLNPIQNPRSKTAATSITLPYEFLISIPLHRTHVHVLLSELRTRTREREKLSLKSNNRYKFSSRESIVKIVAPIGVKDPSSMASWDRFPFDVSKAGEVDTSEWNGS